MTVLFHIHDHEWNHSIIVEIITVIIIIFNSKTNIPLNVACCLNITKPNTEHVMMQYMYVFVLDSLKSFLISSDYCLFKELCSSTTIIIQDQHIDYPVMNITYHSLLDLTRMVHFNSVYKHPQTGQDRTWVSFFISMGA